MVCKNCQNCHKQLTPEEELNNLYSIAKQILEVDNLTDKHLKNIVILGAFGMNELSKEIGSSIDEYLKSINMDINI